MDNANSNKETDMAAQGNWVPACGGTEQPFLMKGYRLLYVWQQSTGQHAYLNLDTDINLTDREVDALFLGKMDPQGD